MPEYVSSVRVRAEAFAADGAVIRNHRVFHGFRLDQLPSEAAMRQEIEAMARHLTAQVDAPMGDVYTGPVLFEPAAAAQSGRRGQPPTAGPRKPPPRADRRRGWSAALH